MKSTTFKKMLILFTALVLTLCLTACGKAKNDENVSSEPGPQVTQPVSVTFERDASVFELETKDGPVYILRGDELIEATKGLKLQEGDVIIVPDGAVCYIKIDDHKNILINEDSVVKLSDMGENGVSVDMEIGQLFFDITADMPENEIVRFLFGDTEMAIPNGGTSGEGTYSGNGQDIPAELQKLADAKGYKLTVKDGKITLSTDKGDVHFSTVRYENQDGAKIFDGETNVKDALKNSTALAGAEHLDMENEDGNLVARGHLRDTEADDLFRKYLDMEDGSYANRILQNGWKQNEDGTWVYVGNSDYDEDGDVVISHNNTIIEVDEEVDEEEEDVEIPVRTDGRSHEGSHNNGNTDIVTLLKTPDPYQEEKAPIITYEKEVVYGDCGKHSTNDEGFKEEDHQVLACGEHCACEVSGREDHGMLPCGHFGCQVKEGEDHSKLTCGHYACDVESGEVHSQLNCGHFACEVEEGEDHSRLACGQHYACEVTDTENHHKLDCGHAACQIAEGENHEFGVCGYHYACEDGYSDAAHAGGACGYLNGKPYNSYVEPQTVTLACGHTVAVGAYDSAAHALCQGCGEYKCDGQDHTVCEDCGLKACAEEKATQFGICEGCGKILCANCLGEDLHVTTCRSCGMHTCDKNYAEAEHELCEGCGAYICSNAYKENPDMHKTCPGCKELYMCSGQYDADSHAVCEGCGKYICEDYGQFGHELLECGEHYSCSLANELEYKQHNSSCDTCGFICQSMDNHIYCVSCGRWICKEDQDYAVHSENMLPCGDCYCNVDATGMNVEDHSNAACGTEGHYNCDGLHHLYCSTCEKWICGLTDPTANHDIEDEGAVHH